MQEKGGISVVAETAPRGCDRCVGHVVTYHYTTSYIKINKKDIFRDFFLVHQYAGFFMRDVLDIR